MAHTGTNSMKDDDDTLCYRSELEAAVKAEREAIAKIIEDAPDLVPLAKNDQGGCVICGFNSKFAAAFIRARGNT